MKDAIILVLLGVVLALIFIYVIREKKRGARCIGCSNKNCNGKCNKN